MGCKEFLSIIEVMTDYFERSKAMTMRRVPARFHPFFQDGSNRLNRWVLVHSSIRIWGPLSMVFNDDAPHPSATTNTAL